MYPDVTIAEIDAIRRDSRSIVRALGFLDRGLAGTDLTPSAVHAILEIGLGNAPNATELGSLLRLEKSTISRLLGKLQARGYLVSKASGSDSRAKLLKLTSKGESKFHEIEDYARRQVRQALSRKTARSRRTIGNGIAAYADALAGGQTPKRNAHSAAPRLRISEGYRPSLLARITEMHISHYARHFGFGSVFERKVATELAEFFGRMENPLNRCFHAGLDPKIVGSLVIDGEDLGHDIAHLRWFILDQDARGQGVGGKLLHAAIAHIDELKFSETHLWTFRGLDAARHLYEKVGFVLEEEKPGQQWGTEVVEQLFIRKPG